MTGAKTEKTLTAEEKTKALGDLRTKFLNMEQKEFDDTFSPYKRGTLSGKMFLTIILERNGVKRELFDSPQAFYDWQDEIRSAKAAQAKQEMPTPPTKDATTEPKAEGPKINIDLGSLTTSKDKDNKLAEEIMALYDQYAKDNDAYKEGFAAPESVGDKVKVKFPDDKSSVKFFMDVAEKNPNDTYSITNDKGEVLGRIQGGKFQVYNGKDGFIDADENTKLPKSGMSPEDFAKLDKKEPSAVNESNLLSAPEDTTDMTVKLESPPSVPMLTGTSSSLEVTPNLEEDDAPKPV